MGGVNEGEEEEEEEEKEDEEEESKGEMIESGPVHRGQWEKLYTTSFRPKRTRKCLTGTKERERGGEEEGEEGVQGVAKFVRP